MAALLEKAFVAGTEVRIWFVGLRSPEVHIARVRSRVALGGHDIPEDKIRERYDQSRVNLIELMPKITELKVYDNSIEADPRAGRAPQPMLILHLAELHLAERKILEIVDLARTPDWAKPLVAAAIRFSRCARQ